MILVYVFCAFDVCFICMFLSVFILLNVYNSAFGCDVHFVNKPWINNQNNIKPYQAPDRHPRVNFQWVNVRLCFNLIWWFKIWSAWL